MSEKEINIRPLFPNAVTMTALAFGVSSINMAFWGHWTIAVIFIALSGVFDFLDGKVARLLNVSSRFGAELDSLSDFVSFGVYGPWMPKQESAFCNIRRGAVKLSAFIGCWFCLWLCVVPRAWRGLIRCWIQSNRPIGSIFLWVYRHRRAPI